MSIKMKLSLSRRPDADAWSIEDTLEKVRAGQIRLPQFQRLFKWNTDDVQQLFDSIIRGFPIGTLLFWKRPPGAHGPGRELSTSAGASASNPSEMLWVLDGQQRLTSLSSVLLASAEPSDERFRIAFALDRDEVIKVSESEAYPEKALPLAYVLDSVTLMTWLSAKQTVLDEREKRRALEIGKFIREYRVPAYIVVADDEQTARLIFDRTNATGKALTKTEVFRALQEGLRTQSPNSLEELQKSVEDLAFGPLREVQYLQAAAALAGLDVTNIDHKALATPALGAALPSTAPALRAALSFLMMHAKIPNASLLPYSFPVSALTRFFHFFPAPRPRSLELLSRWVWRGAISRKHHSHEHKYVRETLQAIVAPDEEGVIQRMLELLPKRTTTSEPGEYNLKASQTRLYLLALLDLHPRDLASGEPLDGAGLIQSAKSAAVPALVEGTTGDLDEDAARATIFGRIIQRPLPHSRLVNHLTSMVLDDEILASLGLDRADVRAVAAGGREPFAARRAERLSAHVSAFLDRRARWEYSDRPSLDSLVVEDEP